MKRRNFLQRVIGTAAFSCLPLPIPAKVPSTRLTEGLVAVWLFTDSALSADQIKSLYKDPYSIFKKRKRL